MKSLKRSPRKGKILCEQSLRGRGGEYPLPLIVDSEYSEGSLGQKEAECPGR